MGELLRFILDHEPQFSSKARLASLYSDFRPLRTTNPDGYSANISAWQSALAHAARKGLLPAANGNRDALTLHSGEELLKALETREWGRPISLGTVIQTSLEDRRMLQLDKFLDQDESIYHRPRRVIPWHVLAWGLTLLGLHGGASGEDKLPLGQFVLLSNVEEVAEQALRQMYGRDEVDRVFTRSLFVSEVATALNTEILALTDSDIDVLLRYLVRDKGAIAYDGKTIKLIMPNDENTSITVQDTTIAALKTLIKDHATQIAVLNNRIDESSLVAHQAVIKKNKTTALAALRSKKSAEVMLSKRTDHLTQLEEVLNSIRQAADQVEMLKVMEASAGVIQSLHRRVGGVERVEEVVDGLKNEMAQVDEIGTIINEVGSSNAADDLELADELASIEREELEALERREADQIAKRLAALDGYKHAQTAIQNEDPANAAGADIHKSMDHTRPTDVDPGRPEDEEPIVQGGSRVGEQVPAD